MAVNLNGLLGFYQKVSFYTLSQAKWVLLDEEGNPIRYFDYAYEGAFKVEEPKYVIDWNNFEECLL